MDCEKILKELCIDDKLKLLTGNGAMTAVHLQRFGIAAILMGDGPYGIKTKDGSTVCFLNTCLMACSWDVEVCYSIGKMLASEVKKHGVDLLLAPAINIKRNPLCGRNFEYYSEDPYLTGKLASAFIKGLKSNGLVVCVKHYACYNQETDRWSQDSIIDDDTLRNVYLKAFEYVVKNTNVDCIMASYNKVNGVYACQNKYLLDDILRKEWGYAGVVMSDWGAAVDIVDSINNGMDVEMPGNVHNSLPKLFKAYKDGELKIEKIDESAGRLLELLSKVNDYREKRQNKNEVDVNTLVKFTGEAMVLLKNEGALPLKRNEKILLVGNAKSPRIQGGGCAKLKTQTILTPFDEISTLAASCDITEDYNGITNYLLESYDKIIVFMYLGEECDSEAFDRTGIEFPSEQVRAIEEITKRNKNIVAVLQNGSAVDLSFDVNVKAVVEGYYSGSYGGRALAEVLYGKITPSGRLTETFPISYEDVPARSEFGKKEKILYNEREFVGYRYYTSYDVKTKYAFGYGLSYCDFDWTEPIIAEKGNFCFNVSLKIKNNSGRYGGKETVQIYLKTDDLFVPKMQLIAFETVRLEPNESKRMEISLTSEYFIRYKNGKRVLPNGRFSVCIAKNCQEIFYEKTFGLPIKNNCTFNGQTLMRELLTNDKYRSKTMEYMQGIINFWAFGEAVTEKDFENEKFLKESVYSMPVRAFTCFDGDLFDEKRMQKLLMELNK